MGNFVDFAEVKERCSIVDAVALLPSAVRSSRKCEDLFFYLIRPIGF
jgi:hypothetical protein